MRFQKVKMVLDFTVPTDPQQYGSRNTDAPWKTYAEHDMKQYLKDAEDIPEEYRCTARLGDISFDWLEEFESYSQLRLPPHGVPGVQRLLDELEDE